ncbi:AEC family transporter [Cohnella nanjingensis]|uniref:AEC family transporter n=1 Tax=Cohnella nanjingensis TaxID=1387779 RepID=A0A7X0RU80_9BACL|nr:AEC family transporter [Cohnella nanjingensis]MBB6672510.1 AEC family transporter [Cohnella nanjingensis]
MTIFLTILRDNVLPISILIAIGILLQRSFKLDIRTLSKLNFYLFSPAIMFKLLYGTAISMQLFGQVILFFVLFMALQYGLVEAVVRIRRYRPGMRSAMRNSVLFYNSANYGIPLNQLAFANNPYTLSVQVLIMMMQSLIPNTYGVYNVNAHKANWREIRRVILSMPVIYVIPLALAMRYFEVPLPDSAGTAVEYLSNAFIGTALITLGVQLGNMSWAIRRTMLADVSTAVLLRLVAGPLLAWLTVALMGMEGLMASALIVSSAVPTSLSSVLLAVEFDNEPAFASQSVFVSTVLSTVTVAVVIALLGA